MFLVTVSGRVETLKDAKLLLSRLEDEIGYWNHELDDGKIIDEDTDAEVELHA